MKLTQNTSIKRNSGMTLIELTVVIVVLLALIAVLFVGAQAYKKGADKAACVMTQRNLQQACRSYFNLTPNLADTAVVDIAALNTAQLMGATAPKCPTTGNDFAIDQAVTKGADPGTLFAPCPDALTTLHVATDKGNW
jgi:type II secretory pathway pseudopilin PulG